MSTNWQRSEPEPALIVHPPDAASLDEAHDAIELWERYSGKRLDPTQRLAVELMMAEADDGRWAAQTTARAMPRQNGKGDEIEVVELWGLVMRAEAIVHTAHEIPTARSAHKRLVSLFKHPSGDLERKLTDNGITYGNGNETIRLKNGGIIVYRTRTSGGGRGLDDISRLVVDEAQHVQPEHLASSMPILTANPNPQLNLIGTAGIDGKSDWWWLIRARALKAAAGEDPSRFSYLEHSAERVEINRDGRVLTNRMELDPADRSLWRKANPAFGTRIPEEFLEEAFQTLGPQLFAREHLCVWDPYPGDVEGFLPVEAWADLKIDPPESMRSVSYGLAVSPSGDRAAVGSAGRLSSGDLYVDSVREEPGTDWVIPYLAELHSRRRQPIRVHPAAPEGAFVRPLQEAGVEVVEVTPRQYQQACGEVLDALKNGTIRHLGQPNLDRAVMSVQRRDVGKDGGWVWAEPASGVDISSLRAATLALTGVTARRAPRIHVFEPEQES